jgi:threonine dehydrogenase-like Zn-dependent dehydrogenase
MQIANDKQCERALVRGVIIQGPMPMPLKTVQSHRIDPKLLITHRFSLDRLLDAYATFGHAARTRALKVIVAA